MEKRIKIKPEFFNEVLKGNKKAELRLNDRDYKIGDIYYLDEFDEVYTGRSLKVEITHIIKNFEGLKDNYVIFSFKKIN